MNCPNCRASLREEVYEGIEIESCNGCRGAWLDDRELGKIVQIREVKFDPQERRAIAESTTITGVVLKDVDRDLKCPKCGGTTDALNYGGDTGIIIDRCTGCRGIWVDGGELEKIQMVIEGWDDLLPEDLKKYGPKLRQVAEQVEESDHVKVSRSRLMNSLINGILDFTT